MVVDWIALGVFGVGWLVWVLASFCGVILRMFGVYDLFCLYCAISLLFVMLCLF